MKSFTDLKIWQLGLQLVKEIYVITRKFPKDELYGMTSQLRRSSTSILANVAEGFGRYTYADKTHKYIIARGECSETETFLLIAVSLGFLHEKESEKALANVREVGRMISGLISSCRDRS